MDLATEIKLAFIIKNRALLAIFMCLWSYRYWL